MKREEWIRRLFQAIDAQDVKKFADFLDGEAVFKFGNAPLVKGKREINAAVAGFFSGIKSLHHDILEIWEYPDVVICRGEVTYLRMDARALSVPFVNIFKMKDNLIKEYLVYVDISEL